MIRKVNLKGNLKGVSMPTGIKCSSNRQTNTPRDSTRPSNGNSITTTVDNNPDNVSLGVSTNPPKDKPHILKGWE